MQVATLDCIIQRMREILVKTYPQFHDTGLKFLDAGCGIGMSVRLAQYHYFEAHGLELDRTCITRAKRVFGKDHASRLIHGNILRFDRYGDYDAIYFWVPF
ncbi:MAG: class I SAM-dependent methyltransferase, partial [Anaerolineae bacterium]|nr:class I SAM-dependent methyltransferase [Anaerolineae bacterium]